MKHERKWNRIVAAVAALAALGLVAGRAQAGGVRVKQDLAVTGVDPDASGKARVRINGPGNDLRGELDVRVRRLDGGAPFEVDLHGVRIGTLTTSGGGRGRARFRTQPRSSRDQLLGVDPRGKSLQVRDASGDPVMEADIPDDTMDPTKIRCCLPDDSDAGDQPECEDRTPDECTAAGGVNLGAGSCLPNPCEGATPPPPEEHIVCCIPDDHGAQCEDRSPASCSEHGGVNLGAGTCDPNPCPATVPPAPETIQCCLPEGSEVECEDRTPEMCAEHGGTNMGPGTCTPNPCPQPPPVEHIRCCLAADSGVQCVDLTADQCTAEGGTNIGAGVCDPSACPAPPPPPPPEHIRCCVPTDGGPACEDRTADECAAHGGTSLGPGSCEPNPCT